MSPLLLLQAVQPVPRTRVDDGANWGDQIADSFTDALTMILAVIPRVLAFLVILIIGWFIASLLAKATAAVLRRVQFNDLAQRAGLSDFIHNMGVDADASGFLAAVVKWFVRLIALVVAFDALGLPAVSDVLNELLLWLPNLVVAIVVLVIGGLAANAFANLVRGATAEAELGNPNFFATIAKAAVWAFAIIIAVNQLGIAETLVNTLFMGVVAALAIAIGLAFGLGGRETAAEIVGKWHSETKDAKDDVKEAAREARRQAQDAGPEIVRADTRGEAEARGPAPPPDPAV